MALEEMQAFKFAQNSFRRAILRPSHNRFIQFIAFLIIAF